MLKNHRMCAWISHNMKEKALWWKGSSLSCLLACFPVRTLDSDHVGEVIMKSYLHSWTRLIFCNRLAIGNIVLPATRYVKHHYHQKSDKAACREASNSVMIVLGCAFLVWWPIKRVRSQSWIYLDICLDGSMFNETHTGHALSKTKANRVGRMSCQNITEPLPEVLHDQTGVDRA